jgi:predicted Rossmann fold flavoprotein
MERACREAGVEIRHRHVTGLVTEENRICGIKEGDDVTAFDRVILCTGGKSYPLTGSDGEGYRFARQVGHTVIDPAPSLIPLTAMGNVCASMQGLSLKNVRLRILERASGKQVFEDFGEMMFTHFGLTGPLVLSASAHLSEIRPEKYEARIDLKPALDDKQLDTRILSDFEKYKNRDFVNALDELLPQKLILPFIRLCEIDPRKKVNSVTKEERRALAGVIKGLRISLCGFRSITEAIITKGGVSTAEINPKTMESKLCKGLYFAGEVIDVDAYTGGYNLQIAFSTGVLAGESAAWR